MQAKSAAAVFAAIVLMSMPVAASAEDIGAATRIVNSVTAELNTAPRALAQGDGVQQNDVISVAADALGELRFKDQTKVALGPGSKLKLDTFVYDPAKASGKIAVDLTKGAFRFVTGVAKKSTYTIRAPNASISVRGTVFDVYVADDGTLWVLLHEGAIDVCNTANQCKSVSNACGVVRVGPDGNLSSAAPWNRQPLAQQINFETAFPFVSSPPQFDPTQRFTRIAVESGQCQSATPEPRAPVERAASAAPPAPSPASPPRNTPVNESVSPPSAPPTILTRGWSGPYAGVTAGAVWQTGDPYLFCRDFTPGTQVCSTQTSFKIPPDSLSNSDVAFNGGGTAGYNFQFGNIVAGLEADFSWTGLDASDSYDQVFKFVCCTIIRKARIEQSLDWLSTVRGRLGMTAGNTLIYATGGVAFGQANYDFLVSYPDIKGIAQDTASETKVGWTGGLGGEYSFGLWSIKAEYLYYDLGPQSVHARFFLKGVSQPFIFDPEFETRGHIARLGVNFRLD
jgi:opacity protein-like surface antigen